MFLFNNYDYLWLCCYIMPMKSPIVLVTIMCRTYDAADMEDFPAETGAMLEELVHHQLLQADALGHEENGIPYVQLFQTNPEGTVSTSLQDSLVPMTVGTRKRQPLN